MKKINYIFYSIGLLICSIILISISIIRKNSSNQIEETTTPTEEVVTGTESPEDKPTNENIIEYCAGVALEAVWFHLLFRLLFQYRNQLLYCYDRKDHIWKSRYLRRKQK